MKIAHSNADKDKAGSNGFKSARWWLLGMVPIVIGNIGHILVLPYADMTLFASTCSIAILFNALLSITMLGEKFLLAYDLTATTLICLSSALTVMQMNTQVDVVYDTDYVRGLLISFDAICLAGGTFTLASFTAASVLNLRSKVALFTSDLQKYLKSLKSSDVTQQ
jgi:hypothetical protein